MVNKDILEVKDNILNTLGETCDGTPKESSNYDVFVVLKNGSKKPK